MTRLLKIALPLSIAFVTVLPQGAFAQEPGAASFTAFAGKTLYGPAGERIAAVYKVNDKGAQVILNGSLHNVPASTLSVAGDKLTTSLTKKDISKGR